MFWLVDDNLRQLLSDQREFVRVREWEQFHTPKNLAMALGGEVGELASAVAQMLSDTPHASLIDEIHTEVVDEIGDVTLYLLRLYDVTGIDPGPGFDGVIDLPTAPSRWPSTPTELFALARAVFYLAGTSGRLLEALQWEANSASMQSQGGLARDLPPRLNATAQSLTKVGGLLGVSIVRAAAVKNGKNMIKYPVELSRGSSRKYTELKKGAQ